MRREALEGKQGNEGGKERKEQQVEKPKDRNKERSEGEEKRAQEIHSHPLAVHSCPWAAYAHARESMHMAPVEYQLPLNKWPSVGRRRSGLARRGEVGGRPCSEIATTTENNICYKW